MRHWFGWWSTLWDAILDFFTVWRAYMGFAIPEPAQLLYARESFMRWLAFAWIGIGIWDIWLDWIRMDLTFAWTHRMEGWSRKDGFAASRMIPQYYIFTPKISVFAVCSPFEFRIVDEGGGCRGGRG